MRTWNLYEAEKFVGNYGKAKTTAGTAEVALGTNPVSLFFEVPRSLEVGTPFQELKLIPASLPSVWGPLGNYQGTVIDQEIETEFKEEELLSWMLNNDDFVPMPPKSETAVKLRITHISRPGLDKFKEVYG